MPLEDDINSFFPVNKNLRAILSLNSSVIMLPSRYINQMIKSFETMGIHCYMKDMHFKCNNFLNTSQIRRINIQLKFFGDEKKHMLDAHTIIKECVQNKKNDLIRCSFNIH